MDYERWSALSDAELARRDIGEINLLTARGLPGAEDLDVAEYLERIDAWAVIVRVTIERVWNRRLEREYSDLTEHQFRMLVMVTTLQRDLGVRYNAQCLFGEFDARDSRNQFIHGPLTAHGGTCASLPFLYVAIGRRLGFPLYLAEAKEHLFVRWEGEDARFNIEATAQGFMPYDDAHYRSFPKALSDKQMRLCPYYLRNMSPREELACCFSQRARVLFDNLNLPEAIKAIHFAHQLCPFYEGAWATMSSAYVIISRMRKLDRSRPWETLVNLAAPKPRSNEEAWAIDVAKRELVRQFKIRSQTSPSAYDEFFTIKEREIAHV